MSDLERLKIYDFVTLMCANIWDTRYSCLTIEPFKYEKESKQKTNFNLRAVNKLYSYHTILLFNLRQQVSCNQKVLDPARIIKLEIAFAGLDIRPSKKSSNSIFGHYFTWVKDYRVETFLEVTEERMDISTNLPNFIGDNFVKPRQPSVAISEDYAAIADTFF